MRVVGADDIIVALEATLRQNVPLVREALGLGFLGDIQTWQIVPDADAIAAAKLPAVAMVPGGVTGKPIRAGKQYDATWDVSVGIFARGKDHAETQTQIAAWARILRAAALLSPTLVDSKFSLRWVGEVYDLIPSRENARTIAGAEIVFETKVENALDLTGMLPLPPLTSVHPDVDPVINPE